MEASNDPLVRFKNRLQRRLNFLKSMEMARIAVYLPPDEAGRQQTVEALIKQIARPNELPLLTREVLTESVRDTLLVLESMQKHLPSDVQYRNRIRNRQAW